MNKSQKRGVLLTWLGNEDSDNKNLPFALELLEWCFLEESPYYIQKSKGFENVEIERVFFFIPKSKLSCHETEGICYALKSIDTQLYPGPCYENIFEKKWKSFLKNIEDHFLTHYSKDLNLIKKISYKIIDFGEENIFIDFSGLYHVEKGVSEIMKEYHLDFKDYSFMYLKDGGITASLGLFWNALLKYNLVSGKIIYKSEKDYINQENQFAFHESKIKYDKEYYRILEEKTHQEEVLERKWLWKNAESSSAKEVWAQFFSHFLLHRFALLYGENGVGKKSLCFELAETLEPKSQLEIISQESDFENALKKEIPLILVVPHCENYSPPFFKKLTEYKKNWCQKNESHRGIVLTSLLKKEDLILKLKENGVFEFVYDMIEVPPLMTLLKSGPLEVHFCKKDLKNMLYSAFEIYKQNAIWCKMVDINLKDALLMNLKTHIPEFEKNLDEWMRKLNIPLQYNWHDIMHFYHKYFTKIIVKNYFHIIEKKPINTEKYITQVLKNIENKDISFDQKAILEETFREIFKTSFIVSSSQSTEGIETEILDSFMPSPELIWQQYLKIKNNDGIFEVSNLKSRFFKRLEKHIKRYITDTLIKRFYEKQASIRNRLGKFRDEEEDDDE